MTAEQDGLDAGDVIVNPSDGDRMLCPGCGVPLYLDPMDGWRNDGAGYTCRPASTTHSDHIVTLSTKEHR